ncbi:metal-dependent hydrolase [Haloprofundus sp. MHR1]|uniref:metal-dependent hydrolase n=1 Tax=Haloprofundus sp. MHR1 TaxID=2572921 RepID=UPI0010BF3E6D|nr:metal-dependent hydrolase [Haloprofundus sp. MHR1]QCJ48119.1 metal-dependent hydrolase [Haloprofundus sp. MHR1]
MFRTGHYGVSLLVFAPIGYTLVSAGAVTPAFALGATMLWLSMLPDVDHKLPGVRHRGPTHTLLFAGLVGGLFWGVAAVVTDALGAFSVSLGGASVGLAVFAFVVGFLTVVGHLVGDALTPMGVNFLWPLSGRGYSLSLTTADSAVWNYGLFVLGVFVTAAWVSAALGVI